MKAGLEFGKVRCVVRTDENPGYVVEDVVANDAAAEFFDYVAGGGASEGAENEKAGSSTGSSDPKGKEKLSPLAEG